MQQLVCAPYGIRLCKAPCNPAQLKTAFYLSGWTALAVAPHTWQHGNNVVLHDAVSCDACVLVMVLAAAQA